MNIEKVADNIYTFPIVLPNNPLKWLNCYVVSSGGRNLLIDTGFNRPECREALLGGMRQLGLAADNTDIFITHLHSDHTGNAAYLAGEGFNILMGRTDHRVVTMPAKRKAQGNPRTISARGHAERGSCAVVCTNPRR